MLAVLHSVICHFVPLFPCKHSNSREGEAKAGGERPAEPPGFCVVNFAANLKRDISHMKFTYP